MSWEVKRNKTTLDKILYKDATQNNTFRDYPAVKNTFSGDTTYTCFYKSTTYPYF